MLSTMSQKNKSALASIFYYYSSTSRWVSVLRLRVVRVKR